MWVVEFEQKRQTPYGTRTETPIARFGSVSEATTFAEYVLRRMSNVKIINISYDEVENDEVENKEEK